MLVAGAKAKRIHLAPATPDGFERRTLCGTVPPRVEAATPMRAGILDHCTRCITRKLDDDIVDQPGGNL